jgi:hypothetical protein
MAKPELTKPRIIAAFAIAIIADLIQLPLTAVEATGFGMIPGEFADFIVDCFVMGATTVLLGFHWILLPSLFVEVIPGLDLIPTWTGCVAFVVWRRKKESAAIIDLPTVRVDTPAKLANPTALLTAKVPPALPPMPTVTAMPDSSIESRLARLDDLREKKMITEAEYEVKRQQVLREI